MITIQQVYNQYKIIFSNPGTRTRGVSFMANNIEEIHEAIDHYYMRHQLKWTCPVCRDKKRN